MPGILVWMLGAILVILALWALVSLLNLEDDRVDTGMGLEEAVGEPAGYIQILDLKPALAG
jgi:hypothetical protein